jgi:FMN phosphatase YigB (HAD superfamily)
MKIEAVIFDYGFTISSEYYFNVKHPAIPGWNELIQECAFRDKEFNGQWIVGKAKLIDIAVVLHNRTGIDLESILHYLKKGCEHLRENQAVIEFARYLKSLKIPIALVTGNFDVFTEVVAPSHGYDSLFEAIINSSEFGETDKRKLWPLAFRKLGTEIGYKNSLLIEDSQKEILQFREAGGTAIQYKNDEDFLASVAELSNCACRAPIIVANNCKI